MRTTIVRAFQAAVAATGGWREPLVNPEFDVVLRGDFPITRAMALAIAQAHHACGPSDRVVFDRPVASAMFLERPGTGAFDITIVFRSPGRNDIVLGGHPDPSPLGTLPISDDYTWFLVIEGDAAGTLWSGWNDGQNDCWVPFYVVRHGGVRLGTIAEWLAELEHDELIEQPAMAANPRFEDFVQVGTELQQRDPVGLQVLLLNAFPIYSADERFSLEYVTYSALETFPPDEARARGLTYCARLDLVVRLIEWKKSGDSIDIVDVVEEAVAVGPVPLMTSAGTFIVEGVERQRAPDTVIGTIERNVATLVGEFQSAMRTLNVFPARPSDLFSVDWVLDFRDAMTGQ